jgi:hypothetical protein
LIILLLPVVVAQVIPMLELVALVDLEPAQVFLLPQELLTQ